MNPGLKRALLAGWAVYRQVRNPQRWPRLPQELGAFLRDFREFRARAGESALNGRLTLEPTLFEREIDSPFDAHYTYQAAWATRRIAASGAAEHVDVSSAVPFVAQLAALLPVTMFEFHAPSIRLPGLTLREASLLELPLGDGTVRSLSCLHVVEHVGLGRYGDPLDPRGAERALDSLARVLAPGGDLYLSAPSGAPRVAFNAHRVFDAGALVAHLESRGLALRSFALVDDAGTFRDPAAPEDARGLWYGLGMYHFTRPVGRAGGA
jgi:SAM-dependent methyltransferase